MQACIISKSCVLSRKPCWVTLQKPPDCSHFSVLIGRIQCGLAGSSANREEPGSKGRQLGLQVLACWRPVPRPKWAATLCLRHLPPAHEKPES